MALQSQCFFPHCSKWQPGFMCAEHWDLVPLENKTQLTGMTMAEKAGLCTRADVEKAAKAAVVAAYKRAPKRFG